MYRNRLWIIAAVVAIALVGALGPPARSAPIGPSFEGKSVGEWAKQLRDGNE